MNMASLTNLRKQQHNNNNSDNTTHHRAASARNGGGGLQSRPSSTTTQQPSTTTKGNKVIPGEAELQSWIEQALYEIHVDAYRGMQSLRLVYDNDDHDPTTRAAAAVAAAEEYDSEFDDDDDDSTDVVQRAAAAAAAAVESTTRTTDDTTGVSTTTTMNIPHNNSVVVDPPSSSSSKVAATTTTTSASLTIKDVETSSTPVVITTVSSSAIGNNNNNNNNDVGPWRLQCTYDNGNPTTTAASNTPKASSCGGGAKEEQHEEEHTMMPKATIDTTTTATATTTMMESSTSPANNDATTVVADLVDAAVAMVFDDKDGAKQPPPQSTTTSHATTLSSDLHDDDDDVVVTGVVSIPPTTIEGATADDSTEVRRNVAALVEEATTTSINNSPECVVQRICHVQCPTLIEWTTSRMQEDQKKMARSNATTKKRRKMAASDNNTTIDNSSTNEGQQQQNHDHFPVVGGRRHLQQQNSSSKKNGATATTTNHTILQRRCRCDYNPFCYWTLGGPMDEALEERSRAMAASSTAMPPLPPTTTTTSTPEHNNTSNNINSSNQLAPKAPHGSNSSPRQQMDGHSPCSASARKASPRDDDHDDNGATTTQWDWSDVSIPQYSMQTSTSLKAVRKSQNVSEMSIRTHLQNTLQGLTTATLSLDAAVQRIREIHNDLIFHNPLLQHKEDSNAANGSSNGRRDDDNDNIKRNIQLSIPPGIENLGATCYLNTQMQCLAQNPVFVRGIMSWQSPPDTGDDDRMSSVLSLFQNLLMRMNVGPKSTVDTVQFSSALGLDSHEQQDPNEFSRLFFDLLHKSFQESSTTTNTTANGDGNLAELLPHLFQGTMMYETTCLTCRTKSQRTEEFMDLNLPIVHPKELLGKQKQQQPSIKDAFEATPKRDTDVQFCLQMYCNDETLDGDNQYYCGRCNCKRVAQRTLKFEKLPPVLNVQLSRYVFDREKCIKKKLSDKVLLPLHLDIEAQSLERKFGTIDHRYILCAVMRHKGTSAYSGHYVAEGMDWITGQWFEFNDDKVVLLENGPSCSYNPATMTSSRNQEMVPTEHNVKKSIESGPSGSPDAYNMYYVEESFLAQSVLDCLSKASNPNAVVDKVDSERREFYSDLTKLCVEDGRAAERLERRRVTIRKHMIPELLADHRMKSDCFVWVKMTPFLHFMSCSDRFFPRMDDLDCRYLLCFHESPGLHPRVARKGKLLPKAALDVYIETMMRERVGLPDNSASLFLPINRVFCQDCQHEYQGQLHQKLKCVQSLKYVYDVLDPKERSFSLTVSPDEVPTNEDDLYAYLVSRRFVTWYRSKFTRFLKACSIALMEASSAGENENFPLGEQGVAEGLDGIDLSEFEPSEAVDGDKDEFTVNGSITCQHGNFNGSSSKSYVFVAGNTWRTIKELFPQAVEHKRQRIQVSHDLENCSDVESQELSCKDCRAEGLAADSTRNTLADLVKYFQLTFTGTYLSNDELIEKLTTPNDLQFRLVHRDDIAAWQKILALFRRRVDKKRTLEEITQMMLTPNHSGDYSHVDISDGENVATSISDRKRLDFLANFFRHIMCSSHHKPMSPVIFLSTREKFPHTLNEDMCLLDVESYDRFLLCVVALSALLFPSEDVDNSNGSDAQSIISQAEQFCNVRNVSSMFHPEFTPIFRPAKPGQRERFVISSDKLSMLFTLDRPLCNDAECWEQFLLSVRHEGKDGQEARALNGNTGVASDPIAVDSDGDGRSENNPFAVRVFDVKADADSDAILSSLSACAGLPLNEEPDDNQFLRRSSRKRKTRYPVGVILEEETIMIDLRKNVASLRLLLMERCTKGTLFELDHCVKLVLQSSTRKDEAMFGDPDSRKSDRSMSTPKVIVLSFDLSSQTLVDLCESALEEKIENLVSPSDSIVIVRQAVQDSSTNSVSKERLMDDFIALANDIVGTFGAPGSRTGGRTVRTEKGFSGTLLSTSALPATTTSAVGADDGSSTNVVDDIETVDKQRHPANESVDQMNAPSLFAARTEYDSSDIEMFVAEEAHSVHGNGGKANGKSSTSKVVSLGSRRTGSATSAKPPPAGGAANGRKRPRRQPARTCQQSSTNMFVSSSDDEEYELLRSPFKVKFYKGPPVTSRSANQTSVLVNTGQLQRDDEDIDESHSSSETKRRNLTLDVVSQLLNNPDLPEKNTEMAHFAAESVISEHPKLNVERLVELAYSAYLELTMS